MIDKGRHSEVRLTFAKNLHRLLLPCPEIKVICIRKPPPLRGIKFATA